jgi:maltooligosyltrehalose trehalohydrolase
VAFSVSAPRAARAAVCFPGRPATHAMPLRAEGDGVFAGVVEDATAGADYAFRLDDGEPLPDPVSRFQPGSVHGPSRVVDPKRFPWTDHPWQGVERPDLVFYELHVGTFTEKGTFDAVIDHLAALRDLGITALELMPVAQFPGSRNWGYDGVFPYAPQNTYGGPEALRRLVDAAHARGLAVLLDVVYNHLGPEGNVLGRYGPCFTDRYRTPWGDALNFDGPGSDEVRRYFVDNALHWIARYHLDGLRLDAVHAVCDASPRSFLQRLTEAVHGRGGRLGRAVHAIAESDANDPRLIRRPERGGVGLDAVWCDDFHHAVHAGLTGERTGYDADLGGPEAIAKALRDRFVFDGVYSAYRQRRHGAPARDLPGDRFVVCVQNHDQVGNRARGDRLVTLLSPARSRLATAFLLLSPCLPLLFMREAHGETRPFLYFVDHGDPALRTAVREGRRREFACFRWQGQVPDPDAPETFEGSRLDRARGGDPRREQVETLHRALLALRREEPALRPGGTEVFADSPGPGLVRLRLQPESGLPLLALFQIGDARMKAPIPPSRASWQLRLDTDERRFGGPGARAPERVTLDRPVRVASDAAWVYGAEASAAMGGT